MRERRDISPTIDDDNGVAVVVGRRSFSGVE